MGCGGCKTTLWHIQKKFFWQNISYFKASNSELSEISYKIHQVMFFEVASKLLLSINWEKWSARRVEVWLWGELRPPIGRFLEWPLSTVVQSKSFNTKHQQNTILHFSNRKIKAYYHITHGNTNIESTPSTNVLGVHPDTDPSFNTHAIETAKKADKKNLHDL